MRAAQGAVVAMTISSLALAVPAVDAAKIKACYETQTGALRIVKGKCRSGERSLRWNSLGPRGARGQRGPQGASGTQGAHGTAGDEGPRGPAGPQGATGASGVTGPAGPTGPTGPTGATGPTGPSGASLMTGRIFSLGAAASTVFGASTGFSDATATEGDVTTLSPAASIVSRDLSVKLTAAPGTGRSRSFTIRDDLVDTLVTCTIADLATTCDSDTATAAIAGGSALSVEVISIGTPTAADALIGWRAVLP